MPFEKGYLSSVVFKLPDLSRGSPWGLDRLNALFTTWRTYCINQTVWWALGDCHFQGTLPKRYLEMVTVYR